MILTPQNFKGRLFDAATGDEVHGVLSYDTETFRLKRYKTTADGTLILRTGKPFAIEETRRCHAVTIEEPDVG